jgi:hypothetical protein
MLKISLKLLLAFNFTFHLKMYPLIIDSMRSCIAGAGGIYRLNTTTRSCSLFSSSSSLIFETGFHCTAQAGLELMLLTPQSSECWYYLQLLYSFFKVILFFSFLHFYFLCPPSFLPSFFFFLSFFPSFSFGGAGV